MKKISALVLTACMSLSLAATLAACDMTGSSSSSAGHTYEEAWTKDATHHWHACEEDGCTEVSDKAAHTWNGGVVTTQPSKTQDGVKTFTCTVCQATKTEAVEYVPQTEVDITEWDSAFDLGENYSIVVIATMSGTTTQLDLKREGGKFQELVTSGATVLEEMYYEIDGTNIYGYEKEGDVFVKEAAPAGFTAEMVEQQFFMMAVPKEISSFSGYYYDENEGVYTADVVRDVDTNEETPYTDITLAFEAGKLVSCSYTMTQGSQVITFTGTFVCGGASVTLPTVA